jgi:hypothetical protein
MLVVEGIVWPFDRLRAILHRVQIRVGRPPSRLAFGGSHSGGRFGETSRRSGRAFERPRRRMAGRQGFEPR